MLINSKPSVTADSTEGVTRPTFLASMNVKFVTTISIGEFANALEVDYDAILQEIINGNKPDSDDPDGDDPADEIDTLTYKLYSMSYGGNTYYVGDSVFTEQYLLTEDTCIMYVTSEGDCVYTNLLSQVDGPDYGTWVLSADGETVSFDVGVKFTATIGFDYISFTTGGISYVLKEVAE
jgi:hypothetical protein